MPAKKAGGVRDASQESRRCQGRLPRKPGASGTPAKRAGYMWRHSLHVSGFFYALRKPPAGRVGAYRIRPPTRPGIWGEYVFLVFKHRFIVIQAPFKRHSNSALRAVGEGRMRYAPTPVRASCTRLSWLASLTPPASAEAGKLAGYLKSPYQANFAGVRPLPRLGSWPGTSKARTKQTSLASADAPRIGAPDL